MRKQHNDTISIAKGIAIILMVLGHSGCPEVMRNFIYMFHIPLFFIVSGYCFNDRNLEAFFPYLWKKVRKLYLPFVKWSLIFLVLHNIFFNLYIYHDLEDYHGAVQHLYTLRDFASYALSVVVRMQRQEQLVGGFWFLRELLFGSILMWILLRFLKRNCVASIGILLLISVIAIYFNLNVPYWNIGYLSFFSTASMLFGKWLSNTKALISIDYLCVFVGLLIVVLGSMLYFSEMRYCDVNNIIPYFICACIGSCLIIFISSKARKRENIIKKTLLVCGNNSFSILTWHFLSFKLVSLMIVAIEGRPIEHIAMMPIIGGFEDNGQYHSII